MAVQTVERPPAANTVQEEPELGQGLLITLPLNSDDTSSNGGQGGSGSGNGGAAVGVRPSVQFLFALSPQAIAAIAEGEFAEIAQEDRRSASRTIGADGRQISDVVSADDYMALNEQLREYARQHVDAQQQTQARKAQSSQPQVRRISGASRGPTTQAGRALQRKRAELAQAAEAERQRQHDLAVELAARSPKQIRARAGQLRASRPTTSFGVSAARPRSNRVAPPPKAPSKAQADWARFWAGGRWEVEVKWGTRLDAWKALQAEQAQTKQDQPSSSQPRVLRAVVLTESSQQAPQQYAAVLEQLGSAAPNGAPVVGLVVLPQSERAIASEITERFPQISVRVFADSVNQELLESFSEDVLHQQQQREQLAEAWRTLQDKRQELQQVLDSDPENPVLQADMAELNQRVSDIRELTRISAPADGDELAFHIDEVAQKIEALPAAIRLADVRIDGKFDQESEPVVIESRVAKIPGPRDVRQSTSGNSGGTGGDQAAMAGVLVDSSDAAGIEENLSVTAKGAAATAHEEEEAKAEQVQVATETRVVQEQRVRDQVVVAENTAEQLNAEQTQATLQRSETELRLRSDNDSDSGNGGGASGAETEVVIGEEEQLAANVGPMLVGPSSAEGEEDKKPVDAEASKPRVGPVLPANDAQQAADTTKGTVDVQNNSEPVETGPGVDARAAVLPATEEPLAETGVQDVPEAASGKAAVVPPEVPAAKQPVLEAAEASTVSEVADAVKEPAPETPLDVAPKTDEPKAELSEPRQSDDGLKNPAADTNAVSEPVVAETPTETRPEAQTNVPKPETATSTEALPENKSTQSPTDGTGEQHSLSAETNTNLDSNDQTVSTMDSSVKTGPDADKAPAGAKEETAQQPADTVPTQSENPEQPRTRPIYERLDPDNVEASNTEPGAEEAAQPATAEKTDTEDTSVVDGKPATQPIYARQEQGSVQQPNSQQDDENTSPREEKPTTSTLRFNKRTGELLNVPTGGQPPNSASRTSPIYGGGPGSRRSTR